MVVSLKEADEWKRRLIADSAHELRTPVSLLQGNLEMIREGIYPADKEHIDSLYEETLLLSRLVGELRDLADAQEGRKSYSFETCSLRELVAQILRSFRAQTEERQIEVKMEVVSGECAVFGDCRKLSQAFSNIVSNAVRYSPLNGSIKVTVGEDEAKVEVAVEDSGEGIEPEEREKIFERFYRTDRARNRATGGSGLGLAVSKEILEVHGGRIYAEEARVLSGARILVQLPKAGSTEDE
jgi:signal transduction histidine kinase